MNEQSSILIKAFAIVWPYVILVTAGAFLLFDWYLDLFEESIALSFFLGSIVSVMLWSMTYKSAFRASQNKPESLKAVSIRNYIVRFLFYALILVIAHFGENLEPIATFVGFTSFKFALIITALIHRKDEEDA